MSTIAAIVGQRIRTYRQKTNMTQEELAEQAELHHTYIGQVERGEKNMTLSSLEKILDALNVSFSDFFEGLEPRNRESIPSLCYEIICRREEKDQQRIYRILSEMDQLGSRQ